MRRIILIGGGGHCKAVIDVVRSSNEFQIAGIVDLEPVSIGDIPYLGNDDILHELVLGVQSFHIAFAGIGSAKRREQLVEEIRKFGGNFPVITAASAIVSDSATLGEGTIVMHNAVVNADSKVGSHNILNTGSLVEHDCEMGNFNHLSTCSVMNGTCKVGDRNFIGSNATLVNNISIGSENIIGAGAVVVENVLNRQKMVGVPAREIE